MINKTDKSFTLIIIRFTVRETGITDRKVRIKLQIATKLKSVQ